MRTSLSLAFPLYLFYLEFLVSLEFPFYLEFLALIQNS